MYFLDYHDGDGIVGINCKVEAGGKIAGRWTVTGAHRGDQLGFAPTNRRMEIRGMSMAIVRDGKVAEAWNFLDAMTMMRQLGFELARGHAGGSALSDRSLWARLRFAIKGGR